jgi:hypothetical protein
MKTPWRFFADLASRRRPTKTQESSIGHSTDPDAFENQGDWTQLTPSPSQETPITVDRNENTALNQVPVASNEAEGDSEAARPLEPTADVEEARATAPSDARQPRAEADVSTPKSSASVKPYGAPAVQHRERTKRTRADPVVRDVVIAHDGQSAQSSSSRDPFFDDAASLDQDIKQLRNELAQKLRLQNAQLKKMLERFGVS